MSSKPTLNTTDKKTIKDFEVTGNGNIISPTITGNGNIINNKTIINEVKKEENTNLIQYQIETKGKPIKRETVKKVGKTSLILAIIAFIADIVTIGIFIYSILNTKLLDYIKSYWTVILIPASIIFVLGLGIFLFTRTMLNPKQFAWIDLKFTDLIYKSMNEEYIYRVKIEGSCPKCGGKVNVLKYIYKINENESKTEVEGRCIDNPSQHKYKFDPTTLTGTLIEEK